MIQAPRRGRPKTHRKRMVPIIVLVPPDLKSKFEAEARENNLTLSQYVRDKVLAVW